MRQKFNLADAMAKQKLLPHIVEHLKNRNIKYGIELSVLRFLGTQSKDICVKEEQMTRQKESTNVRTDDISRSSHIRK